MERMNVGKLKSILNMWEDDQEIDVNLNVEAHTEDARIEVHRSYWVKSDTLGLYFDQPTVEDARKELASYFRRMLGMDRRESEWAAGQAPIVDGEEVD